MGGGSGGRGSRVDLTRQLGSLDYVTPVTEVQKCCKEKGVQRDRCGTSRFSGLTTSEGQTREELNPVEPWAAWVVLGVEPCPGLSPLAAPFCCPRGRGASFSPGSELPSALQAIMLSPLDRPASKHHQLLSPPLPVRHSLRQTFQHARAPRIPLPISCFGCYSG